MLFEFQTCSFFMYFFCLFLFYLCFILFGCNWLSRWNEEHLEGRPPTESELGHRPTRPHTKANTIAIPSPTSPTSANKPLLADNDSTQRRWSETNSEVLVSLCKQSACISGLNPGGFSFPNKIKHSAS